MTFTNLSNGIFPNNKFFWRSLVWALTISMVAIEVNAAANVKSESWEISDFPQTQPSDQTRCRNHLGQKTGGIFYQPFKQVLNNERCVWQISAEGATGYHLKILHLGYSRNNTSSDQQGIIFTAFARAHPPVQYLPTTTDMNITDCTLLIVTFYTGPNISENTGFALEYKTIFSIANVPTVASESRHYQVGPMKYYLRHPEVLNSRYNELTFFVFLPFQNIANQHTSNTVLYKRVAINKDDCSFQLKIYFFSVDNTTEDNWKFIGRIVETRM